MDAERQLLAGLRDDHRAQLTGALRELLVPYDEG